MSNLLEKLDKYCDHFVRLDGRVLHIVANGIDLSYEFISYLEFDFYLDTICWYRILTMYIRIW